jgi:hypothetical protein
VPVAAVRMTAPVLVPEAGVRVSHAAVLLVAVQLKVPPPVLLILSDCVAGLLPP